MHFRRLTAAYFERYSAADIARHLHLIAGLNAEKPVDVEIRPLASHAYEMLVVGLDHSGTVACIAAALAAHGFNLEDVQVASYLATEDMSAGSEPSYFVVSLRMSGNPQRSLPDLAADLRERLRLAFSHLAQGNLLEAQTVAADTRPTRPEGTQHSVLRITPRPAAPEFEGMTLGGDFRLLRKLASGGMSEVYLATQLSLSRTVAIKVFKHEAAGDEDLLSRFYQEGTVLGQFNCPYIVQILAAGSIPARTGGGAGWMAMEYVGGGDLARWQQQHGTPSVELATRWFREALEGLHYAHRHAILHRDLKPHNLLLTSEGHLKVSDFGLLKQIQQPASGLTPHSAVIGTPHYMSPEQALGDAVDERSDIFSLGTTFFHLLSGRLPFTKNNTAAVLVQIAQEDAPQLLDIAPQTPVPLAVIVRRMMARKKDERYQDAGVILEDLASYERRGLLKMSDLGAGFYPMPSAGAWPGPGNEETQAYQPPAAEVLQKED
jgi:hypothetical protein